jgi:hypothetical protein
VRILLTLFLALHYFSVSAQVDTLQNKSSIENFLKHKYNYKSIHLYALNSTIQDTSVTKAANPKYFLRSDFNHDGKSDLLISASVLKGKKNEQDELFVLNSQIKGFTKVNLDNVYSTHKDYANASFSTYSRLGKNYIVMSFLTSTLPRLENGGWATRQAYAISQDTLFVMNNKPMIYSNRVSTVEVERVRMLTTMCFGTCPVFELAIKKDGSTSYRGLKFVERIGDYKLRLNNSDLTYFYNLIKNIHAEGLKNEYAVDYTDAQTAYLTIEYSDGKKKQITDYGLQGTYGLSILYSFLYNLRNF